MLELFLTVEETSYSYSLLTLQDLQLFQYMFLCCSCQITWQPIMLRTMIERKIYRNLLKL